MRQGFVEAKLGYGGSVLGSSQFSIFPVASKVVKSDSKIIISIRKSKSLTHSVERTGKFWNTHRYKWIVKIDHSLFAALHRKRTLKRDHCQRMKPEAEVWIVFQRKNPP